MQIEAQGQNMPGKWKSLKGKLLLDGGSLNGSFFHRTVVLICQHDENGAFGLVLNKASAKKIADVMAATLPDRLREQLLFVGGPVQPNVVSFLHTDALLPDGTIIPNLALGQSLDQLIEIGESYSPTKKARIFAGYAGWSAGQLDSEMDRKAWLTHPASLELVFDANPDTLWRDILLQKNEPLLRLLADSPEDLSWN
ncbi:MAG TPA: YqgE/AlgH family protein [Verrucomicrobiae bacterium]|nr:YqgE/AlgH family protein [Verrucomicrobiae bacterium]